MMQKGIKGGLSPQYGAHVVVLNCPCVPTFHAPILYIATPTMYPNSAPIRELSIFNIWNMMATIACQNEYSQLYHKKSFEIIIFQE